MGDAIISPAGAPLKMMPDDKYADPIQAFESLKRLRNLDLPIDRLLVGDGEPIRENAMAALTAFLSR